MNVQLCTVRHLLILDTAVKNAPSTAFLVWPSPKLMPTPNTKRETKETKNSETMKHENGFDGLATHSSQKKESDEVPMKSLVFAR